MQYEKTDPTVSFEDQLQSDHAGPVILVALYSVPPEQIDAFVKVWTDRAHMMKQQPGFISAQLHRGVGGASLFVNYVVWESLATCRVANKASQAAGPLVPGFVARPVLVEKIAIPGLCVA
jgi:quinol monooxygenase YgiN